MKTITMFDQLQFPLTCGHSVVLARIINKRTWRCEQCDKVTDLEKEPYRTNFERDRDRAHQLDAQARERGEEIVRADGTGA
jgi:hypothetical protein